MDALKLAVVGLSAALTVAAAAAPERKPPAAKGRTVEAGRLLPRGLADLAQGTYFGDVISDARGSSRSEVRITVTKIAANRVRVSADYARLPPFEASLARYLDTVQNVGGDQVFLLDLSKRPTALSVTVDDASWSGAKE